MVKRKKNSFHKFVPKTLREATVHGTFEYVGKPREGSVVIDLLEYDESIVRETKVEVVSELAVKLKNPMMKWIRVTGVHDAGILTQMGKLFNINSIDIEDIANTTQRPGIEERESYIFLEFNLLQIDKNTNEIINEQVTIIQGDNYVITFHETAPKIFDPLRSRIITGKVGVTKFKSDYLVFALTDIIVDHYFLLLEEIGNLLENTEDELIISSSKASQDAIYKLNRRLVYVKKIIWPTREILISLKRSDHPLITDNTKIYFSNIYDHTVQIIETLESMREITSGMMDLYLSSVSNRMNEVIKVLTIFSTIFIPLTFFAGVYGMNFKYFPELQWEYGYLAFWIISILISITMLIYFRRKKWL